MDKGPWKIHVAYEVEPGDVFIPVFSIYSEDFEKDVQLEVTGDFADDADRRAYCEWLADVLNAASERVRAEP